MKLFLGVDGGQSSTTALVGDESGRVVGVGRGGPCNHVGKAEGREKFLRAVGGCLRAAGFERAEFDAACLGFSGGAADKEAYVRELIKAKRLLVTHDAAIALTGATSGEPGVIAIGGTGSMAFGRNREGKTARAGGWGYAFGDEGGGFDIVRQALRAALREEEGWGPKTALRDALVSSAGATSANDLLHRFYTDEYPRERVAAFAKLVDRIARDGDAVAREILLAGAQQLATLASAVRAQIFDGKAACGISYLGGVFRSEILLGRYRMLMELDEGNRVAEPEYGPAAGALIEAYRTAGLSVRLKDVPSEK
ncbi:MAG TPA: BadF/BadG/BcrA/BcrD ATPase family protein [Bryobacteraceae bacterium]|nr:BadF/BadG/BcrA/BcrD ATPase family protein [Bryobacteraceae bacterium]